MPLKVIGAGFGRTGTTSLKAALELLGYEKCHHMTEVIQGDKELHWHKKLQGEAISWEEIFNGYQAAVDWPAAAWWKELTEYYPDARVILTVRDADRWYDSITTTIYPLAHLMPQWLGWVSPRLRGFLKIARIIPWKITFNGRIEDAEYAKQVFNAHNTTVQATIAPERLLIYEISQGWEPLCKFLNVPIPADTPFPRANEGKQFKKAIGAMKLIRLLPYIIVLPLLGWLVYLLIPN